MDYIEKKHGKDLVTALRIKMKSKSEEIAPIIGLKTLIAYRVPRSDPSTVITECAEADFILKRYKDEILSSESKYAFALGSRHGWERDPINGFLRNLNHAWNRR